MQKSLLRKVFNIFSAFAILSQSLTPYALLLPQAASAQEITAEPTPTVEQTTETTTPTPTVEEVSPTQELTPTPTEIPVEEVTPVPTEEVTPTETQPVDNNSPPSTDSSNDTGLIGETTVTPEVESATIEPTQEGLTNSEPKDEQLNIIVLENVSAPSIDLDAVESQGSAVLTTDKPDYAPTDTALITGSNLLPNTTYTLRVWSDDQPPTSTTTDVTSDENGVFVYAYQLDGTYRPNYSVELKDLSGAVVATVTFTDANPSANLNQCANDQAPSPHTDGCSASANDWVNGNVNEAKSVYIEGDSIPYRMLFDNLSTSISHNVIIEWDTTKSGKHAIDYLTTFNRTVATANPCLGVSGCAGSTTFAIPTDSQVTGAGVTPVAGNFTLYGGTITSVSAYSYVDGAGFVGDKSARITITFTTTVANPVLAWGGHIATRSDWGPTMAATSISGSPYHTRLVDLDGAGGNQDRSLSASAVIFPATITIIKDAVPNNAQDFSFTTTGTGLSNFSLDDDADITLSNTRVFSDITVFGDKTVTEGAVAGWSLTGLVCTETGDGSISNSTTNLGTRVASLTVEEGENISCTFTNTQTTGTITVNKTLVPSNDSGLFNLQIDGQTAGTGANVGNGGTTGAITVLTTGTHTVSETAGTGTDLSDYTTTYSCNNNLSGNGTSVPAFSVSANQNVVCTFTNTLKPINLTLVKTVTNNNGGTASATDWTLSASGPTPISGTTGSGSVTNALVTAGTYTLSESGPGNYTAGSWVCTGDGTQNGDQITLAPGDNATCTINNNDNAPQLHLRKTITNDNGGAALITDWTLTATGTGGAPTNLSGTTPVDSDATFKADTYALAEINGPSGYTAGAWNCGAATMPDATHVTVPLGGNVTCTINNNDNQSYVIVNKTVINNNGGSAQPNDFLLTVDGNAVLDEVAYPVNPGVHTAGETLLSGYTAGAWGGDCNTNGSVTVALGETKTCTITNNDQQAYITVVKVVTNNNGGTADPDDFDLTLEGNAVLSGVAIPVNPGTYTADETLLPGYTFEGFSGDCNVNGDVTIALGESKTCTLTNNDIAPTLRLVKSVTNNDGGNAVAGDWDLTATGGSDGFTDDGDSVTFHTVTAGVNYTLTESTVAGYAAGSWSCNGGTQNTNHITLGLDDDVTCTIINNDIAPTLKLVKNVNNSNGGNAVAGDWDLTATGGSDGFTDDGATGVFHNVTAGVGYVLSESNIDGYDAGTWSCTGGNLVDSTVTLGLDEDVTCSITNYDQQAQITLIKNVINDNGGTADPDDFGISIDGFEVLSGSTHYVNANTPYVIDEAGLTGYNFVSITGDTKCPAVLGGSVTLDEGESITCTITNNDQPGGLIVHKITDPADDETVFSVTLSPEPTNGNTTKELSTTQNAAYQQLNAGTYSVTEEEKTGWDQTPNADENLNDCTDVIVTNGETTHCYITNTKRGNIIVTKYNDEDGDGELVGENPVLSGWKIKLNDLEETTGGNGTVEFNNLVPGTYTLGEELQLGWEQTGISCPRIDTSSNQDNTINVPLEAGQTVFCQILNHNLTPILTISKSNNAVGDKAPGDTVGYTITLNISRDGGPATNVQVTDLLPQGFVYVPNSWGASSTGLGTLSVPEPTYASPGVWNLVDTTNGNIPYTFQPGDTITLTYSAKIDGSQQTGTYYDNAWAQGTAVGNSDLIFATAVSDGDLNLDPDNFVGTQVNLVNGSKPGIDYKATQQVLGAEILPATGENTLWVIIATLLGLGGFGTLAYGLKLRRKYVK